MNTYKREGRLLVSFDWVIERLLSDKANFDVVGGFLSELLGRSIKITAVLENESKKIYAADKYNYEKSVAAGYNRTDVMAEDAEGEVLLIELLFMAEIDYLRRKRYGVGKTIVEHLVGKDEYAQIRKVYSINIVDFDLGRGNDYIYYGKTDFRGLHENDTLKLSEKQQDILAKPEAGDLYPEHYILKINNFNDVTTTTLDEWVYYLKNGRVRDGFAGKGLSRASEILDYGRLSEDEKAEFLKNGRVRDGFTAKGLIKASEILDYSRLSPEEKSEYDYYQEQKSRYRSEVATVKEESIYETEKKYAEISEEKDKALEEIRKKREVKEKSVRGLIKASEILDYGRLSEDEKAEYDYYQEQKSRYRSEVASATDEDMDRN